MNIEASSSKPKEAGFLAQFSPEQQDFFKKFGIETKDDFDLYMSDVEMRQRFEAILDRKEKDKKDLEIKKAEVEAKRENIKQNSVVERQELQKDLQIATAQTTKKTLNEVAATPLTPENSAAIQKKLEAVGAAGKQLGIDSLSIGVNPIVEKSLQRVAQNPQAKVEFDLVSGELLVEGIEKVDQNYLAMAAFDAAFAHQIPDLELAKINREDIVELAKIFDLENGGLLSPRVLRGFSALAQLAKYNFVELKNRGIFNEKMELNKYAARRFANLNRGELRETGALEVANLYWNKKEISQIEGGGVILRLREFFFRLRSTRRFARPIRLFFCPKLDRRTA